MKIKITDLKKFIREQKPNVKQSSIESYFKSISSMKSLIGFVNFDDEEYVMDKLSSYPINTQNNYLMGILIVLNGFNEDNEYDEVIDLYKKTRTKLQREYEKNSADTNHKTDFQKEHEASLDDVNTLLQRMEKDMKTRKIGQKGSKFTAEDNTLLNQYTIFKMLMETADRNEMSGMILMTPTAMKKIKEDDRVDNYLVKENGGFTAYYYDHKMKGKLKTNIITKEKEEIVKIPHTFSPELVKILKKFIKIKDIKTGQHIFTNSSDTPYSRNQISQILAQGSRKYIGKNIGSRVIRHLIITKDKEPINVIQKQIDEQKEHMAKKHGHTVHTMDNIYDDN